MTAKSICRTVAGSTLLSLCLAISAPAADSYLQRCADEVAFVESLYRSVLGRDPSGAESQKTMALLGSHKNREKLIVSFFDSDEYAQLKKDNRAFVLDLFHGILGREPEASEVQDRMAALVDGKDRWMMVRGFIGSMEYKKTIKKCP